ncbi:uncharacterized protein LOC133393095 [Anopheles gambiae]|uniref:uncharacterized protein LOC133393095 n=1 Tax=Anopheles gambiae TaxID=7165 RepID=UPI002AC918BE|nr:uncharacterized protein LOC133393095 [Anopheles gambiae]
METDFDTNSCPATEENFAFFEETITLEQIKKSVALGICRLTADVSLPQTKISQMIKLCEHLVKMLGVYFEEKTKSFLTERKTDLAAPETINFLNKFHVEDLFSEVSTRSKQTQFLNNLAVSIPRPVEKLLQTREDIRHIDGIPTKVIVNETFMYIPITETLKLIFRNPQNRKLMTDNLPPYPTLKEYSSFRSGETYQNSEYFKKFPDAIRINLYQDDVELGNALSSRAGINKVSVFDFKIENFPSRWNSSPKTIFPLIYCTSIDSKKHGFNKILEPLIHDLRKLEHGVDVFYGTEKYTIRAVVTMFCGDTLAVHEVFGLMGPMAKFFCRLCTIPRPAFHQNPFQNFPMRTTEWYEFNLEKVNSGVMKPSDCGLKRGNCILNELQYYHITQNFALDTMHDIAEGLVPITIQLVLGHYHKIKSLGFSASFINDRIHLFAYGYIDKKNRPSANFTDEMLSKPSSYKLKQTASQNLLLLRSFPFLFADKVPANCEYMRMIGHLLNITRILMSTIISDHMLVSLEELIRLYEESFYKKFQRRLNKNHHLDHYIQCIKKSGNMKQYNCLVFEQKNKPNKNQSSTCRNFKNICKSLAQRQCFTMAIDMLDNPFTDNITYYGGNLVKREHCNSVCFIDLCVPHVFVPNKATVNGIDFRKNLLVCIKNHENEYYPSYGIIVEIVVMNSAMFLLIKLCKTNGYNDCLEAYEVAVGPTETFVSFEEIHSHTTFAFWSPFGSDKKYVSRRNYCQDY